MITYREATVEDAISLSKRLRPEDEVEVFLTSSRSAEDALVNCVSAPEAEESWAAEVDGKVIAMWGVHRQMLVIGSPWLLASPEVTRYAKRLVKDGRKWVNRITPSYPLMTNFVHAENTSSINWLKSLGFTIGDLFPEYGVGKAPFHQFFKFSPLLGNHHV